MDARAPAVVALVVARDPGPWFEEALASLGAQDYAELSVLVVAREAGVPQAGVPRDVASRVGEVLPDAFVRHSEGADGFAAAVNEALPLVEGEAFFLLCHDDVALEPDAVHLMVEEAFRSNAAVVTPKMFRWDEPRYLLHVGLGMDRLGAPVDRVQEDEVDHGQHDAVREVFAAPGGCALVRSDLLHAIGGFDSGITAFGEDVDLSWRAQIAGARIVVAPQARCRHLEATGRGLRPIPADHGRHASPRQLERRHELRALLKCASLPTLLVILPRLVALNVGELIVALVESDRDHARAVRRAWSWNLHRLPELWTLHREVARQRRVSDRSLRRVQSRGSTRLAAFVSRFEHSGLGACRGEEDPLPPPLTGTVGHAFSENTDFDELDDLGQRHDPGRPARTLLGSSKSRLVAWLVVALILVVGTRGLITGGFPLVGQFVSFPSWTGTWHQFVAGWQPAGVGSGAPATPAYAALGVLGTVLFGGMGLAQKVTVLGCIPFGVWGLVRFLRPYCSSRARLAAGIAYLGLALPYDALARGRWDGLLAYAAVPWMLGHLSRATERGRISELDRAAVLREILALGVIDAVAIAFVPALGAVLILCALGFWVGGWLVGQPTYGYRVLVVAAGATVVALVLCLPWAIGVLASGRSAIGIFGATSGPWSAPTFGALLRFDVGPVGGSPLSWLIPVAALLPLVLAARERLEWASRLWVLACGSWILAWVVGRGLTGSFSPDVDVLLAPAAAAVAACVGLGVAAFETDLSGFEFGWRQLLSSVAVLVLAVGLVPVLVEVGQGQWGVPSGGFEQSVGWMSAESVHGASRVLWLGDPRDVPGSPWRIQPGLAFTTSGDGAPEGQNLFAPAGPGAASGLSSAVDAAMEGRTSSLGQLLAQAAVRYVVVVNDLAPQSVAGGSPAAPTALPGSLLPALQRQGDLSQVPTTGGFEVFQNTSFVPARAQRRHGRWVPVLGSSTSTASSTGTVGTGTIYSAFAPAGSWTLAVGGRSVPRRVVHGWAAAFPNVPKGTATLRVQTGILVPLGVAVEVLLWLASLLALTGIVPAVMRRRRAGRGSEEPVTAETMSGAGVP